MNPRLLFKIGLIVCIFIFSEDILFPCYADEYSLKVPTYTLPITLTSHLEKSILHLMIQNTSKQSLFVRKFDKDSIQWNVSIRRILKNGETSLSGSMVRTFGPDTRVAEYESALVEMHDLSKYCLLKTGEQFAVQIDLGPVYEQYQNRLESPKGADLILQAEISKLILLPKAPSRKQEEAVRLFHTRFFSDQWIFSNGVWSKF